MALTLAGRTEVWRMVLFPLLAIMVAVSLAAFGRVGWCEEGDWRPWSWDVWTPHNSQHLVDPYTLSHLQHGIGLYALLLWLFPTRTSSYGRAVVVALVEALWEVAENTPWMIARYRETTMALGYEGDSIANSVADYGACMLGVWLAMRLPVWASVVIFSSLELISLWWIHDSLLLNVLMLVWPLEAIKQWQMGGAS